MKLVLRGRANHRGRVRYAQLQRGWSGEGKVLVGLDETDNRILPTNDTRTPKGSYHERHLLVDHVGVTLSFHGVVL